jgi:hypothetical protein
LHAESEKHSSSGGLETRTEKENSKMKLEKDEEISI